MTWHKFTDEKPAKSGYYLCALAYTYPLHGYHYTVLEYSCKFEQFNCFDSVDDRGKKFAMNVDYWTEIPPFDNKE